MEEDDSIEREKLSWLLRLITLGDRFSYQDFFDRFKKGFVEFLIVFFGVLVSFSVEQQGEEFGDRESNLDNLKGLRDELVDMHQYTLEYIDQNEWVTGMYQRQYDKWDQDNDSVFIDWEPDQEFYFAPMGYYTNRDAFNPPRVVYDAIKLDGTFRFLGSDIGRLINDNYDGTDLKYLIMNTDKEEKGFIDDFSDRLGHQWVFDLKDIDVESDQFWIENRKYIQSDKFIKYNLFKRIQLWIQIREQLGDYDVNIQENIKVLNKVIAEKESEITIVWWWFSRPSWLKDSPKSEPVELPVQEPLTDQ
tara:strand:- start:6325 stop:7236 length:912 start_codon:yes stop_codon:yes gene_type:complete